MKMHSVYFGILIVFLGLRADAAGTDTSGTGPRGPHHNGLVSSINLGVRYSSVLETRGVILYRDFQIDPVVGLFFFDDRVEFLGDSLGYRDFVAGRWLRLRSRFVSITDKPLFPAHESVRAESPKRPDTYEWSNSAEFFLPAYDGSYFGEVDLTYAKDISATHGDYLELLSKAKVADFRLGKIKIEPNLFGAVGWGNAATNKYYYGTNDASGFNNVSYGLWFSFPEEADRYYPIIQIRRFQVLGDRANGEFARGRNEGWLFSFIATFGVLDWL